jgi:peptide/nickel transport system ATP-binding protein
MSKPFSPIPLLHVRDLCVAFNTRQGRVRALENIAFNIQKGETVAVVGESGSGKSVTAAAILGILDKTGSVTGGDIVFSGMELLKFSERDLRSIRGREIAMIFQNPRAALNPIRSIGRQIEDVLQTHGPVPQKDLRDKAIMALNAVNISSAEHRYHQYPFELSGGMCQRVMIAMAISCRPALLIADEPTTGLDVTTQANIMELIKTKAAQLHMSTMLITHDLNMAARYCDKIIVMHAGHVVETAPTAELYRNPLHPYTQKLIAATPSLHGGVHDIDSIPGNLPNLLKETPNCRFAARCQWVEEKCVRETLATLALEGQHTVACWRAVSHGIA